MNKYVFFIKNEEIKVVPKELVTQKFIKGMKDKGFRKHHVEVESNNEKEAVSRLNENEEGYLNSLREFSGSVMMCSLSFIAIALYYFFTS